MKKYLVVISCLLIAFPAFAKQKGKMGKGKKTVPHGIEKKMQTKKSLPPGWQKKLKKGDTLDEDVLKSSTKLNAQQIEKYQIPKGSAAEQVLRVENKIIRVMRGTREILGVFDVR